MLLTDEEASRFISAFDRIAAAMERIAEELNIQNTNEMKKR